MKVGIFTNNYLPNPYGVSGSVETFRSEFEKLGHEVYIFAPNWPGYRDENKNVFRYPSLDINIKFRFPLPIPYLRKMDKILEKLDLDIIHSQHPNLLGVAASKWARKKKIPLVFTWHTLYDRYANFVPFLPARLVAWWTVRNARHYANRADQVIVPTESIIPILENWGVKKNIKAVATGVDEEIFKNSDGEKIRKKFNLKEADKVLLLVSRLTEEKNVEFIFGALKEIILERDEVKFLVVGGGYLQKELEKWTRKEGLDKKIFFAGEIKREETKNYYAASDIFVYSSLSETQGMIVTEAMYMGLSIVAVRATGISSLVENERNGFLTKLNQKEFAEKVAYLLANDQVRKQMAEASKAIAKEKYTARICAEKMIEVYEELISK